MFYFTEKNRFLSPLNINKDIFNTFESILRKFDYDREKSVKSVTKPWLNLSVNGTNGYLYDDTSSSSPSYVGILIYNKIITILY